MTRWAQEARLAGFDWVVPCDADELWYSTDGRRLADRLADADPTAEVFVADLYGHVVTPLDSYDQNPFRRIRWRRWKPEGRKVACRLQTGLFIGMGNHAAHVNGEWACEQGGLGVRHFPYRSFEQYARKVRQGARAIALTDFDEGVCMHWRRQAAMTDEELRAYADRVNASASPERTEP